MAKSFFSLSIAAAIALVALGVLFQPGHSATPVAFSAPSMTSAH